LSAWPEPGRSGAAGAHNRRRLSADPATIRALDKRLPAVQDNGKLEPHAAAVRGGFASHRVVTQSMAEWLLARRAARRRPSAANRRLAAN